MPVRKSLLSFVIFFALLAVFYSLCLMLASIEAFETLVWRLAFSLGNQALSTLLLRLRWSDLGHWIGCKGHPRYRRDAICGE